MDIFDVFNFGNDKKSLFGLKSTDDGYVLEVCVPGFSKSDISVKLSDGLLWIKTYSGPYTLNRLLVGGISSMIDDKFDITKLGLVVDKVELLNGVLSIYMRSYLKEVEYEINIPQPSSSKHPSILNEDSAF